MIINNPENYDTNLLDEIEKYLEDCTETYGTASVSEMNYMERRFLSGIIRENSPKKILELGVSAGGSSLIILNAIKDLKDSKLYSIDYLNYYYRNPSKEVGWIVKEKFKNLTDKWVLYTNGVAAKFMDDIGGDIDICLIDTMHQNPGEFIDFLMILPYMKKGGIIIIHDTLLHINYEYAYTNAVLFSCIKGKKYTFRQNHDNNIKNHNNIIEINSNNDIKNMNNIGAVILDENVMDYIFDYFSLLTLPWTYLPKEEDINYTINLFNKHYDKNLIELFSSTSEHYIKVYNKKNEVIPNQEEKHFGIYTVNNEKYFIINIFGIKITIKKKAK